MSQPAEFRNRFIAPLVLEALVDTRIVMIQGARQVGKSTLAGLIASDQVSKAVSLDDETTRGFALDDPEGFVTQFPEGLLVIDEIQRAPGLAVALKAEVDRDRMPGRFLVTGSANLLDLTAAQESLAGRVETISLHSFSQGELEGRPDSFIDAAFAQREIEHSDSDLTKDDYLQRACAGGYPEALSRQSPARRSRWYKEYLAQVLNRDASDISGLRRLSDLPRILRLIAARSGSGMVWNTLATDAGIPRRTLDPYVKLLETLYLVFTLPAWAANLTGREVKQPKVFARDTGLLTTLLGISAESLAPSASRNFAGALLETFVVDEVLRQSSWSAQRVSMHHFRDSRGNEVDLVLETPDGRVVGIEVKAASTVQSKDVGGLVLLRERLGDRFAAGYVLHTGHKFQRAGNRIYAAPISALWHH